MRSFVMLALVLSVGASANALTLKEKQQVEATKKELTDPAGDNYVKAFKEKCGYDLPVTFEEKMVTSFMAENASLSGYCDAPRSQLATMCEDATAKASIKAKIKKVTCHLGKAGESSFKLVNGDLQFTVGTGAGNLADKTKEFVENNL